MNGDDVDVDVQAMAFGKKLGRLALQKQQYTDAQLVTSCIQCPGEKHAILMERLCGKTSVLHTQGLDTLTLQIQHCVLNEDENEDDVDKSKQQQQRRLEVNAFFEVLCCIHEQRGFSYLPLQPSLVHECFCYLNMTDEETKNHQTYRSYLTGAKDASLTFKHNDVIRICCNYLRTNKAWLDMGKVFQYITKLPLRDLIIAIHNSLVWGGNDKQHTTAASKQKRQPSTTTTTTIGNSCALTYQEKFGIYIVREYKLAADLPDSHMGVNDAFLSFLECVLLANLSLCVDTQSCNLNAPRSSTAMSWRKSSYTACIVNAIVSSCVGTEWDDKTAQTLYDLWDRHIIIPRMHGSMEASFPEVKIWKDSCQVETDKVRSHVCEEARQLFNGHADDGDDDSGYDDSGYDDSSDDDNNTNDYSDDDVSPPPKQKKDPNNDDDDNNNDDDVLNDVGLNFDDNDVTKHGLSDPTASEKYQRFLFQGPNDNENVHDDKLAGWKPLRHRLQGYWDRDIGHSPYYSVVAQRIVSFIHAIVYPHLKTLENVDFVGIEARLLERDYEETLLHAGIANKSPAATIPSLKRKRHAPVDENHELHFPEKKKIRKNARAEKEIDLTAS